MVLRQAGVMIGAGVVLGVGGALALTRLVTNLLFHVQPNDAMTIVLAVIGIAVVAGISGYMLARRATLIDPIRALRWE